jgi:hypothetical protein
MISGAIATVVRELAEHGVLLRCCAGGMLYAAGPRLATCPACNEVRAFFYLRQRVHVPPDGAPVSLSWAVACLACADGLAVAEHHGQADNSEP